MSDTTNEPRQTTTEWARENGRPFTYTTALDNYEPTRDYAGGRGWFYELDDERGKGIVLDDVTAIKDAHNATYLVDDGRTVAVYYVAGWHPQGEHVILHPVPTNYNDDGTRKIRPDNGREVSFDSWQLGPRRAYHLKIRETD